MKIQAKGNNYLGKKVMVCNEVVEFDNNAIAEVKEDKAKEILEAHPDKFYEEGKVPVEEVKPDEVKPEINKEELNRLKDKITEVEKENTNLKKELKEAKEGSTQEGFSMQDIELVYDLTRKKKSEIEEQIESLELPKEEWEGKSAKELVLYLFQQMSE